MRHKIKERDNELQIENANLKQENMMLNEKKCGAKRRAEASTIGIGAAREGMCIILTFACILLNTN